MKLYLVTEGSDDPYEDDRALFVWADDPEEAATYWSAYYDGRFPGAAYVYEAPITPECGAVNWKTIPCDRVVRA